MNTILNEITIWKSLRENLHTLLWKSMGITRDLTKKLVKDVIKQLLVKMIKKNQ